MFKNKKFVFVCLSVMSVLRKIYSPLIFWILWFTYIRWVISDNDVYAAKLIWDDMLHSERMEEFRTKIKRYDWMSEPKGGLLDFTYQLPWLNFCGTVPTRLGRDCDDFAELAWKWCEIHNTKHMWQIMCMRDTIKSAHIFTVAKAGSMYIIINNNQPALYLPVSSLEDAMETFLSDDTVWVIYKHEDLKSA